MNLLMNLSKTKSRGDLVIIEKVNVHTARDLEMLNLLARRLINITRLEGFFKG